MSLPGANKSFLTNKGRYFQVYAILISCIVLNFITVLNSNFIHFSGFFTNNNAWYHLLIFLSAVFSFSIYLVCYYTYPQVKNVRLLIAGFTFLTVGLIDFLNLLISSNILYFLRGNPDFNQTLLVWLVSRLINAIGFGFLISIKEETVKVIKRRYLLLLSFTIAIVTYFLPFRPVIFVSGQGMNTLGLAILAVISLVYVYSFARSIKEYKKEWDILYMVMSCIFILMFFSLISMMSIRHSYDGWNALSQLYQFFYCTLSIKVFYIHGIQRPYILLSKTKEELNEYIMELDKLVDKRTIELRCINEKLLADQEIARGMQLSMLPATFPSNEYVAFSAGYVPADNLSGDFYNVFKIDEERYGICIGDVSGHGVSAAMLSIFTFQKMQSLMEETGGEGMAIPSLVLRHLYDSFNSANFSEDMYIVMMYGVINVQTGIFSYASGGLNTTPLRIRPDGSIQELDNDGYAICKLGDLLKPKFVNHQILMFPGDKLVLYTDGLTDARNTDKEEYSLKRLKNTILKNYKWGVEHLSKAIIQDVKNFTGVNQADDITVLSLDILPPF